MKAGTIKLLGVLLVGIVVGFLISKWRSGRTEGFSGSMGQAMCGGCNQSLPCGCGANAQPICPPCVQPDLSQYVLKTTVPQCSAMPDLSQYILKSEIPPVPDLSKYVLKSSIVKPQPIIMDCSRCNKSKKPVCPSVSVNQCPDCNCPVQKPCPVPAPCPRVVCPVPEVKCKAVEQKIDSVRPYLAPLNMMGFGLA